MDFPNKTEVLAKLREKNREDYKSEWYALRCQIRAQLRQNKRKFEVFTWVHAGMPKAVRKQLGNEIWADLNLAGWGGEEEDIRVRVTQDWFPIHNTLYALRVKVTLP